MLKILSNTKCDFAKLCRKCGNWKLLEEFGTCNSQCLECRRVSAANLRAKQRAALDKLIEYGVITPVAGSQPKRVITEKEREKRRLYKSRYKARHPEKFRQQWARYSARRRGAVIALEQKERETNEQSNAIRPETLA